MIAVTIFIIITPHMLEREQHYLEPAVDGTVTLPQIFKPSFHYECSAWKDNFLPIKNNCLIRTEASHQLKLAIDPFYCQKACMPGRFLPLCRNGYLGEYSAFAWLSNPYSTVSPVSNSCLW
jgi:hypothetical protein